MSDYGNIPELLEEVEYLVGRDAVKMHFINMLIAFEVQGERWLDNLEDEADIERCFEFRRIVDKGHRQYG